MPLLLPVQTTPLEKGWPPALGFNPAKIPHPGHRLWRESWIEEQLRLGRNAMAIYQDLVELFGFTHRYNSVKRFVRGLKTKDPRQYDRLEFLPGEEAQVDYGAGAPTLYDRGKYRRPRLFVMVLKYSGRAFRKVVWKSSKETWCRLHEEALLYAKMLSHYGVAADPARVNDPNRKGTVENGVKYTQNTALKGRRFDHIEAQNDWLRHWEERWAAQRIHGRAQNDWLRHWEERWAAQRIHGRAKRQVEEMFQEEKPHLAPLPLTPFVYFREGTRTVYDDGTIQVGNCYYAASPAPLYSKVVVRIYDKEIEILDPGRMEVIRRHPKSKRPGSLIMEPRERIFNPSRQTDRLLAQAEVIGVRCDQSGPALPGPVRGESGRTGKGKRLEEFQGTAADGGKHGRGRRCKRS